MALRKQQFVAASVPSPTGMRRFVLLRRYDVNGVSGTGIVAQGMKFSDGSVVIKWLRKPGAVAIYPSLEEMVAVHGHDGWAKVMWEDE
jgi:hypothetical protein